MAKYVVPSRRSQAPQSQSQSQPQLQNKTNYNPSSFLTEKRTLKKEFQLTANTFPTLSETIQGKQKNVPMLSFAAAAKKKEEIKPDGISNTEALLPGWLYIRRRNGRFEYREGPISLSEKKRWAEEEADTIKLGYILAKYRIAQLQYERDMDVERLGDFSEYYNEPTIEEMMLEDERQYQMEINKSSYNKRAYGYDSSSTNSDYE